MSRSLALSSNTKRRAYLIFQVSIFATASDIKDLRLKEAVIIKRQKPVLNRREELLDINCLTAGINLESRPVARDTSNVPLEKRTNVLTLPNRNIGGNRRITRSMTANHQRHA